MGLKIQLMKFKRILGVSIGVAVGVMVITGCGDNATTTPTAIEQDELGEQGHVNIEPNTSHDVNADTTYDEIETSDTRNDLADSVENIEEATETPEIQNDGYAMLDDFISENGLEAYRDKIVKAYGNRIDMMTSSRTDGTMELLPEEFSIDHSRVVWCTFRIHDHQTSRTSENPYVKELGHFDPDTGNWKFAKN